MRPFEAGDVFRGLFPLGDSIKDRPVIIAVDEDATDGTLIACTSTDDSIQADNTTPLNGGCHPLIDKDCSVVYGEAQVIDQIKADRIRQLIASGVYRFDPNTKLSPADTKRVQDGFGTANGIPLDQRDLKVGVHKYAKQRGII